MSDDPTNILSFLQAMQTRTDTKLNQILERLETSELRPSMRDTGLSALRRDQADQSNVWINQQDQLTWIKARLEKLEEATGTTPPPAPQHAAAD